jgi:hypothetical protein
MAFTAAVWSVNFWTGVVLVGCQMNRTLSLPPDANCRSSGDHCGREAANQAQADAGNKLRYKRVVGCTPC